MRAVQLGPDTRALVTGATGFVGANVVRRLLERGVQVRALVRATSSPETLEGLDVERCVGDLRDAASLARALDGMHVCFHVAADYRLWVPDPEAMIAQNAAGTRSLIDTAVRAGVERVVYTSSVATVKIPAGRSGVETDWLAPEDAIGVYKRSKVLAEQEALAAAQEGAPVVIVNPSAPFGPWDVKPTPTGAIVERYLKGGLDGRGYIATGLNVVDVRDCAEGHLLAAEKGVPGERYILGGENVTLQQILELLADITGGKPPFKVPRALAWTAALLDEFVTGTLRGKTPKATREALKMARYTMWFDSSRAHRELGFTSRPARAALEAAVEWCRAHERGR